MELISSYHIAQYFCQKHSFPKGMSKKKKPKTKTSVYGLLNTFRVWLMAYIRYLSYFTNLVVKQFLFQSRIYIHRSFYAANYSAQTF